MTPGHLYVASEVLTPLFHVVGSKLTIGSIVPSIDDLDARPHSAFFLPPDIAPTPDLAARSKVEQIFEAVRTASFPAMPSRRRCHFACLSTEAADRWRKLGGRADRRLFRVQPEPSAKLLAVYVRFFDYAVQVMDGRWLAQRGRYAYGQANAEAEVAKVGGFYWRGEQPGVDAVDVEVLVDGTWELVEGPL